MLEFISANLSTIIVGLCLAAVIAGVVIYLVNNKRKGKSSCGCGCANCALKGTCHSNGKQDN